MRTVVGVVAILTMSALGTLAWGGAATRLVAWTFAGQCEGTATADCVVTLPARVEAHWDSPGRDEATLTLVPLPGSSIVGLSYHDFYRLGAKDGDEVRATLFDGQVTALTRAGRTVSIEPPPAQTTLRFLLLTAAAAGALVLAARRRGWGLRAAVCSVAGAFAGMATAAAVPPEWAVPALPGVAVLVGAGLSFVRLPRAWTAPAPAGG
ncbi:MAG TPA: hypothetical protein VH969_16105 [Actinophytocola sp.]|uniref:hypothetical protein n=1 Tax=Actinophytocola sp. TaxID=1872138 RepID=UPI002F93ECF4